MYGTRRSHPASATCHSQPISASKSIQVPSLLPWPATKSQLARPGRIQSALARDGSVGGLRFSTIVDSTMRATLPGDTSTKRQGDRKGSVVLTGSRWSIGKRRASTLPCLS